MIDRPQSSDSDPQPLNSYNVAQLHFALTQDGKPAGIDSLAFDVLQQGVPSTLHTPQSSDVELDYSTRRMSSSAASDSSLQSRPDKRAFDFSPSASPIPKKSRPEVTVDPQSWSPQPATNVDQEDRSDFSSNSPRVQLPSIASTFLDRYGDRRASLPTILSEDSRLRLPTPAFHRPSQSSSGLVPFQFPISESSDNKRPPLAANTQLEPYSEYSLPNTAVSSSSSFSFPGGSPSSGISTSDCNWTHIIRPNSTPGQIPGTHSPNIKYDENYRHSISGQLYGGVTRISGQHHHLNSSDRSASRNSLGPSIKTEGDWTFPSDFSMSPPSGAPSMSSSSAPAISVTSSPQRSPQAQAPAASSLVERPPRKRGKLPKPVTDFLKDWLHRHSDHPYPSEEEKKQLCHATGLSMSQVSNWMINARRRILAPAHRAAAGPTTNTPYATQTGRSVLDTGRRASMPDSALALYHPMSLQSLPEYSLPSSTRHLVGISRSMSSSHATVGSLSSTGGHGHHPYNMDSSYAQNRLSYGAGGALHPSQHVNNGSSSYLSVPLSAPASMSNPNPFLSSSQQQSLYQTGNGYGSRVMTPESHTSQARYTFPDTNHSVSPGPGSGYNTPH